MTAFNWRKIFGDNGHHGKPGFLARLRRDQKGNTLAIMAAALIPMIGMVGSAVDISRAYLVKVRLQQACDAGVLAARRSMTGQSIANDTNAKTQATNFFKINLKNGAYGSTVSALTVTDANDASGNATGLIDGSASADVPTSLMRIFGKTKLTMTATCEAQLQVANNDVMFVLDTTGSMNCAATDTFSTCQDNGLVEKSNARIKALRSAVTNFYTTLNAGTTSGSQLRIGFVPYSTTVNVGGLLPASYFTNSGTYQSRVANFNTAINVAGTPSVATTVETYGSLLPTGSCDTYGANKSYPTLDGASSSTGTPPANVVQTTYAKKDWGVTGTTTGTNRTCRRTKTVTTTPYTVRYAFTNWTIGTTTYNTSAFNAGSSVPIVMAPANSTSSTTVTSPSATFATPTTLNEADLAAADNTLTATSTRWGGCIEERQTIAGQSNFSPIPAGAKDLNIDLVPDPADATTQWHPWWPEVIWGQNSAYNAVTQLSTMNASASMRDWFACPKAASRLTVMTATDVSTYVDPSTFKAVGFTYHDVGMLWGLRLLSPTGIFAAANTTAPNGKPINRHIIFMTDGDMEPEATAYNLYGHEYEDKRVSGAGGTATSNLMTLHNARFAAICQAAKGMNVTIWVIAYAQSMTTQLSTCASPGKAYYAGDDTALNTVFQTIAQQIAELRLSK